MSCIQILDILETHYDLKHIPHAQGCLWEAIQKTPTSFQQVAGDIDIVVRKII
jgi:hypothetical protein